MLALRDDPVYEDVKTCHVLTALEAAMQIQKKKIIVGPNDSVGILLFNTVRANLIPPRRFHNGTNLWHERHGKARQRVKAQKSRKTHICINLSHQ
jgi:hypothetical protein